MLFSVDKLTVKYGDNVVIKDASFAVNEGDFICVVGANGSGKSTLVKSILGLIEPSSGKVKYAPQIDRTQIGYLPQETRPELLFPATVEEIVLSGCLGHMGWWPFYRAHDKQHARDSLKTIGIEKLAKEHYSKLSGGQKQKVLLARSLSATQKILILDEPSNNLDFISRRDFYATLKRLNGERGLTVIMITHDLDADDLIGNKIIEIKDGAVRMLETEKFIKELK